MKKKITNFLLIISLLTANLFTVVCTEAASPNTYNKNAPSNIVLFTNNANVKAGKSQTIRTRKIPSSAKNVRAVSSNKKVATVSVVKNTYGNSYYYSFRITAQTAGIAKIKFTANVKGKKVTDYTKVKVVKYKNPVTSFKIGSKEYASKFKKAPVTNVTGKFTNKKTKVTCVPSKDWCVKRIDIVYAINEMIVEVDESGTGIDDIAVLTGVKHLLPTDNAVGAKVTAVLYNAKMKKTMKLIVNLV